MANISSTKKLNILHVTKWYPNAHDVQNGVFVQKQIASTTHFADVKILAWLAGGERTQLVESVENGIAVTRHYFKPKTTISFKRHLFREYIRCHCNDKNLPDIVHLHIFSPDLILVFNWAKKKKIPVVISEHWSGYQRGIFKQMPFYKKWAFKKLGGVQQVLPVSNYLEKHMKQCGISGAYSVVPNVINENLHRSKKQETFTFLIVADMVDSIKNISGIITAFNHFAANENTCQLHIIGGGPDEEKLNATSKKSPFSNRITWFGRQKNEFVLQHLPTCHVLINNSRFETFGVTILEAHAAGIPVISTLCGGPNEWLEDADFAIPVDEEKALLSAMKDAFDAKDEKVSFEKWRQCLPAAVGEKLREVYAKIVFDKNI